MMGKIGLPEILVLAAMLSMLAFPVAVVAVVYFVSKRRRVGEGSRCCTKCGSAVAVNAVLCSKCGGRQT
jgi:Mn2+/Fe2+ NRAMP family transporter